MKRIISLTLVFVFLFAFTTAHSESSNKQNEYVLNTSTLEFHKPSCSLVNQIKNNDKEIFFGKRVELIRQFYIKCQGYSSAFFLTNSPISA